MMNRVQDFLSTPLVLGEKTISSRLILAPMAGITHVAFRKLILKLGGCGLLYTEMCLASLLIHERPENSRVFKWDDKESPFLVCQLLGRDVEKMQRAASRIEEEGFFGVDINMGCSVPRILKKGMGAALLKEPDRAVELIRSVRKTITLPLLVKFRTGWEERVDRAVELAKAFEGEGADGLIFHPRVVSDIRSRIPKWHYIEEIKKAVSIPVFGNGNVFHPRDMEKMLQTGCDGIALGRIAAARPWIFAQVIYNYFLTDRDIQKVPLYLLEELPRHFEVSYALRLFKNWARYFFANFLYGHEMLKRIGRCNTKEDMSAKIREMLSPLPPIKDIPNLNLLR